VWSNDAMRRPVGSLFLLPLIGLSSTLSFGQTVTSIQLSPANVYLVPGFSFVLALSAKDTGGNPVSIPQSRYRWTASNPDVVTIGVCGKISGVRVGSTDVTVNDTVSGSSSTIHAAISGDDHFWTADPSEMSTLLSNSPVWDFEGTIGWVQPFNTGDTGLVPLWRFLDQDSGTHFWTEDSSGELFPLYSKSVVREGIAGWVFNYPGPGTVPMYRFSNPLTAQHFWGTELQPIGLSSDYTFEGVAFYLLAEPAGQAVPFNRAHIGRWPAAWTAIPATCTCSLPTIRPKPDGRNSNDGSPTQMTANFIPTDLSGNVVTLAAAGAACGFTNPWFNWQQTVSVSPSPKPISVCSIVLPEATKVCGYDVPSGISLGEKLLCSYAKSNSSQPLVSPWSDPPSGGGYTRETYYDDAYPFYLTASELSSFSTENSLRFNDTPAKPVLNKCLQTTYSFIPTATAATYTTSLVGIVDGKPSAVLYSWTWKTTYNGTSGGIVEKNLNPVDPGSGTGGVSIVSINGVALPLAISSDQVATTASGLAYSRVTQTFNGTIAVTNIGSSNISGPLHVLLTGITPGVTLVNATRDLSGTPYITLTNVTTLAPGQSATLSVQFKNPSNAAINFRPAIYSGSIN